MKAYNAPAEKVWKVEDLIKKRENEKRMKSINFGISGRKLVEWVNLNCISLNEFIYIFYELPNGLI